MNSSIGSTRAILPSHVVERTAPEDRRQRGNDRGFQQQLDQDADTAGEEEEQATDPSPEPAAHPTPVPHPHWLRLAPRPADKERRVDYDA